MTYATEEQALQYVSEYMKSKGIEKIDPKAIDALNLIDGYSDGYQEYFLKQEEFEMMRFCCNNVEIFDILHFSIMVPENKEDFLTLMKILDA